MEDSGGCTCGHVANSPFGLAVLVVGVDAAKGQNLICMLNGTLECSSVKQSVICIIMLICHVMGECKSIISFFRLSCGLGIHDGHEVDICKVREVINEDGGTNLALFCREASVGRNESKCRIDTLVDTDNLAWCRSLTDFLNITDAIAARWETMFLAVFTVWTGGFNIFKVS